jgi:Fur family ferric uptake transcriptional regulator
MKSAKEVFNEYLKEKNLKHSKVRDMIIDIFLKTERHLTAEELYFLVSKKYSKIGFSTVYRTLKHLIRAGLCREIKLEDGITRYEHLYGHQHHDHIICIKCGKFVEVVEPQIEILQEGLFEKYGFIPKSHRMELYGICKKCIKKNK